MHDRPDISFSRRLVRAVTSPSKLAKAISARVRSAPFRLGVTSLWPGTYLSYLPERYSNNYSVYLQHGGSMDHNELRGYVKGNNENNCGDLARYYFLRLVADQILKEGLRGDVAELGVYRGNTAFLLARIARQLASTAYLLDTYEGFPQQDLMGIDSGKSVSYRNTSLSAVRSLVGNENVRFIQGRFPDSVTQMPDNLLFSLVHLDCDLYAPFHAALRYFYPRLIPGGFLVMHDYSSLSCWNGPEKAVDEFFADKPEKVIPIPDKSGTAAVRKL